MLSRVMQVPRVTTAQESGLLVIPGTMAYNTTLDLPRVMNNAGTLKSLPYADGTGASGTWGINISGNAAGLSTVLSPASGGTGVNNGSFTLTINANSTINQNVTTTGDPTFNSLSLTTFAVANNFIPVTTSTVSTGGTTNLNNSSTQGQTLTGTLNHKFKLPNGSALTPGWIYTFNNNSTGTLTVNDSGNNLITVIPAGGFERVSLSSTAGPAGTWDNHGFLPPAVSWGTTALNWTDTGNRSISIGSTTTGDTLEISYSLSRGDFNSATSVRYLNGSTQEFKVGLSSGSDYYTIQNASNQFLFYLGQSGDLIIPSLTGAVVTTGSGGGIGSVTGTANQVLRISGTNIATFGAVDISSTDAVTGTLAVANGGTGQTSYTNGQLLIGNTTGNTLTKATLTGTASQITVTNGAGSITLSLPQNIATTSAPTFIGQTYTGYSAGSTTGIVNFSTATNGLAYITIGNLGRVIGTEATTGDFIINRNITYDGTTYRYLNTGAGAQVCLTTGTVILKTTESGIGGNTATFNNALVASNTGVSIATGDLTIDTAGKGLRIKQGDNAMFGTGAVLVAGTVRVSTTAVTTRDTIFLSCTAAGGTQGIPRISAISNNTSFTITSSNAADTSTYSWLIIKAA